MDNKKMDNENIDKAMFVVFSKLGATIKNAKANISKTRTYNYSTIEDVLDILKPLLIENGLYFTQSPSIEIIEGLPFCTMETTINHVESGTSKTFLGKLGVKVAKEENSIVNNPQDFGATITYLRRYTLVSIFAIEQEDTDTLDKKDILSTTSKPTSYKPKDYTVLPTGQKIVDMELADLEAMLDKITNSKKLSAEDILGYTSSMETVIRLKKDDEDQPF